MTYFASCVDDVEFDGCDLVSARRSDPLSFEQREISLLTCLLKMQASRDNRRIDFETAVLSELRELRQHQNEQPSIMYQWFSSFSFTVIVLIVLIWLIRVVNYNLAMQSRLYCRLMMMVTSFQRLTTCSFPSNEEIIERRNQLTLPIWSQKLRCRTRDTVTDDIELD
uniref:Uncharacterized protein n=1 Tax=Osugoroshi virus TaxID=2202814 RepID=A0A679B910_9VIRU|nr:hypothetical protein [Osugoroshi virus]